jgi:hypothetical protein
MNKIKKITISLFCASLFFFTFISNAVCITTQGDTTFGVNENESLVWTVTDGSPEVIGFRYNLTIQDIYNGSYMTVDSYIINATLRFYNKTEDSWSILIDNAFFVAANETQNFIDYDENVQMGGLYFIIPTPINLTMIGEYANSTMYMSDYEVDGSRLTLTDMLGIGTYILIYNSDGIITKMVAQIFGITVIVMVLGLGGGGGITFGFSFAFFALIAVVGLIYLKKRNTK